MTMPAACTDLDKQWIDPDVCLPRDEETVLVVDDCGDVKLGCHNYDYWRYYGYQTYETKRAPRWWMRIPPTPGEERTRF